MEDLIVLAMIAVLMGHRTTPTEKEYADAIARATPHRAERALLVAIARQETWFHARSKTPPFGLTWWARRRGWPSIEHGARLSIRALRFIHRERCRGASLAGVVGRYIRGNGCHPSTVSHRTAHWWQHIMYATRRTDASHTRAARTVDVPRRHRLDAARASY